MLSSIGRLIRAVGVLLLVYAVYERLVRKRAVVYSLSGNSLDVIFGCPPNAHTHESVPLVFN